MDFEGVRAIVAHTSVQYFAAPDRAIEFYDLDEATFQQHVDQRESPDGPHLILLAAHRIDGQDGDESQTQAQLDAVAGLFAAFNGRNMVYERISDSVVHLTDPPRTDLSELSLAPRIYGSPDVSPGRLSRVRTAGYLIEQASPGLRRRAQLSLRWLEDAIRDTGVGAFIKSWIAVETIGVINMAKLKPIADGLGRAYGIPTAEARHRFHIDRVNTLRDRVVHLGNLPEIDVPLLLFVQALYVDLLNERLQLPAEHRAAGVMERFNIDGRLTELLRGKRTSNDRQQKRHRQRTDPERAPEQE